MPTELEQELGEAIGKLLQGSMRVRMMSGRPYGLRGLEATALETLLKLEQTSDPRGVSPSRISGDMGVQGPVLSPVLTSLEERGYIQRRTDENDRRCSCVSLTDQGREVGQRFAHHKEETNHALAQYLGEHDSRELTRLLGKLAIFVEQRREAMEHCGKCRKGEGPFA